MIDSSGVIHWDPDGIGIATSNAQHYAPHIINDGSGGAIIVFDDWRLGTSGVYASNVNGSGVLPVELASFSASAKQNAVELGWNTATEVNNYGFEIERRETNSQFTKVGFVAGSGSSTSPREYSYEDKNLPFGRYSYRIKQINHDGTFKYTSETDVIINDIPASFSLGQNYPNPFNPSTMISYDVPRAALVHLAVYDLLGRKVAELVNEQKSPGHFQVEWNATAMSSGNYYVRMESQGFVATRKLALLK
jgi:hypothetical protein